MKSKTPAIAAMISAVLAVPLLWTFIVPALHPAPTHTTTSASEIATDAPTATAEDAPAPSEDSGKSATDIIKDGIISLGEKIAASQSTSTPTTPTTSTGTGTEWNSVTLTPADATAALPALTIRADGSMSGYSRDEFPHWLSSDLGSGCDTRDAVLFRDAAGAAVTGNCKVTGTWLDPYTGKTVTDGGELDIDHMVPLAEGWRSGATAWTEDQRAAFANDPGNTLAADASANREKGDRAPEDWKPANQGSWCGYSVRWVQVKTAYKLTVTDAEVSALRDMLATCA